MPDFPRRVPIDTNIADIVFTSSNVLKQLKNLKVNSSAGPDAIKPIFDKNLAHCLAEPLATMFNTFLEINFVRNGWLTAHVKPLFKNGLCSDCNNYRPISLTWFYVRLWSASLQPTCFSIYEIIIYLLNINMIFLAGNPLAFNLLKLSTIGLLPLKIGLVLILLT